MQYQCRGEARQLLGEKKVTPTLHDLSSFFFFLIKKTRLITYTEKTEKYAPNTDNFDGFFFLLLFFFYYLQ